ncbi:hypothetical protein [Bacillus sp. NPDC077027]|uniref:hypothetical protein n=1 Tax=Bacillus sp. NPDC077027 TaxID=3390548 RepID=UPI003CFFE9EC
MLLGKHELFDDEGTGRKPHDILTEVLGYTNIPIIADFDCAHTLPMLTMPIGKTVKIDAERKQVWLTESTEKQSSHRDCSVCLC